jgi:hypothetical protein
MSQKLPPSASVAHADTGAKLVAPAAERNAGVLLTLLRDHAPASGTALEIASGTGQHISAFAAAFPALHWHPTDVDAARLASIDAYVADAGLSNVAQARFLDATTPGWSAAHQDNNLILLINLTHLISTPAAQTLITEAALALSASGTFILYGPFKRNGQLTSAGDARFDAELRDADDTIGYKDDLDILRWLGDAGFANVTPVPLPANNLAFVARKVPS